MLIFSSSKLNILNHISELHIAVDRIANWAQILPGIRYPVGCFAEYQVGTDYLAECPAYTVGRIIGQAGYWFDIQLDNSYKKGQISILSTAFLPMSISQPSAASVMDFSQPLMME